MESPKEAIVFLKAWEAAHLHENEIELAPRSGFL
jgi:hypothetical protein